MEARPAPAHRAAHDHPGGGYDTLHFSISPMGGLHTLRAQASMSVMIAVDTTGGMTAGDMAAVAAAAPNARCVSTSRGAAAPGVIPAVSPTTRTASRRCASGAVCLSVLLPRKFGVRTCASLRQRENLIYFGGESDRNATAVVMAWQQGPPHAMH